MALWLNNIFGGSQNGLKKKVSTDIDMGLMSGLCQQWYFHSMNCERFSRHMWKMDIYPLHTGNIIVYQYVIL